jgi:hypothetical protein
MPPESAAIRQISGKARKKPGKSREKAGKKSIISV